MELSADLFLRIAATVVTICVLSGPVKRILRSLHLSYRLRHLPGPPSTSLLMGNAKERQRPDRHRVYTENADAFGHITYSRVMDRHIIQVTDPALIAEALRSRDLDKPSSKVFSGLNRLTGPHALPMLLTAASDERWKRVRKAVAAAFSTSNMKAQFPNIRLACSQLIDVLKRVGPEEVVDMDSAFCRESLDVIGRVGFGRDMGATRALAGDDSGHAIEVTSAAMAEADALQEDPLRKYKIWRKDVRAGARAMRDFHAVMQDLLAGIRQNRPAESSIAAHLMDIKDPHTGKPLDDVHLLPEISILFIGGFETTGHTAAWTLFSLSQHPEVEAKLAAELAQQGLLATPERPVPRAIDWDDIPKLTYLQAVIKEAMRKYPAGGVATMRIPKGNKDVVLGTGESKFTVPAGAMLHMPIAAVHMCCWDRPEAFIPERFLEAGAEDLPGAPLVNGRVPQRFMPFSHGARDCVGQTLAHLNLATTLAQLYGSFTFRLAAEMGGPEAVAASEVTSITLSCRKGMKMHAIPRVLASAAGAA